MQTKDFIPPILIKAFRRLKPVKNTVSSIDEDITALSQHYRNFEQESLIIGNGPSFKEFITNHQDFSKGKNVFCVNNFVETEYFDLVKPNYYVFADPAYWNQNCSPKLEELMNNIFNKLKVKVSWKITILLPIQAKKWNYFSVLPKKNENINLAYYNNNTYQNPIDKFQKYKQNLAMPPAQNVLVTAIFLSMNLGSKTCYIIGGDMSLHEGIFVNDDNTVCYYDKHFYDKIPPKPTPFWKDVEHTTTWKMNEIFNALAKMFEGFRVLEEYANYLNVKILNISKNSYIDSFERKKLS